VPRPAATARIIAAGREAYVKLEECAPVAEPVAVSPKGYAITYGGDRERM
jgi:hypothetical protein